MWQYVNGIFSYLSAPTKAQAFRDALNTRRGSIPGNPGYGGRLIGLIDAPLNDGFRQRAMRELVKIAKSVGLVPSRVIITVTDPGKSKVQLVLADGGTLNA